MKLKKYTIQCWCAGEWKLMLGTPDRFSSRAQAEERLRFEAGDDRRCRLVNGKGTTVLHAGKVPA